MATDMVMAMVTDMVMDMVTARAITEMMRIKIFPAKWFQSFSVNVKPDIAITDIKISSGRKQTD